MVPGNRLLFHTIRHALLVMGSALAFLFLTLHHSPLSSEPLCAVASDESSAGGRSDVMTDHVIIFLLHIHKFALQGNGVGCLPSFPSSPATSLVAYNHELSDPADLECQLLCSPAINEYDLFRRSYPYVIPM